MSLIKIRQREWHPYKATKIEVLSFFLEREIVTCRDLMDRFDYSYQGARDRLWRLHREKLIEPLFERGTWGITELAIKKLDYFNRL